MGFMWELNEIIYVKTVKAVLGAYSSCNFILKKAKRLPVIWAYILQSHNFSTEQPSLPGVLQTSQNWVLLTLLGSHIHMCGVPYA